MFEITLVLLLLLRSQKGLERGRWCEGTAAAPTATSNKNEELREAFEAVEQEKELEGVEEEEIPTKKQQEDIRAGLTSSELALFEDPEAEHSTAVPAAEEQAGQSASEPVDQAVVVPEAGVGVAVSAPEVMKCPNLLVPLSVVTNPLKPPIVAMPIHSPPGSSITASFADLELAEFEAMDLDAQLDRLEMLSSPVGKAKSKAVEEALERLKI
ncbi:unnamed protein product [Prunus armeniaca]